MPIVTEVSGYVKYGDIIEGVTMEETLDERTGARSNVIVEAPKDLDVRPRISIKDDERQDRQAADLQRAVRARYFLPVGSNINVPEGTVVHAGDVIAKIPRETTKTKDITGGLPRVAELFEARKPKEHAVISRSTARSPSARTPRASARSWSPEVGEPSEST